MLITRKNCLLAVALSLIIAATSFAQAARPTRPPPPTPTQPSSPPQLQLISISPDAPRIDDQFPAAPPKISTFYFMGEKGTSYVAVFEAPAEPASIVGVGANISSTSYNADARQLTINFVFDQSVIPPVDKPFPSKAFLLALDPGAPRSFTPLPRPPGGKPPGRGSLTSAASECYGPLNGTTPTDDKPGPPLESAGTFMSTNVAEWCVIPPTADQPFSGYMVRAKSAKTGYIKHKISPTLVKLLSLLSGRDLTRDDVAIFNGDVEASKSVTATDDGGLLISVQVSFNKNSTVIAPITRGLRRGVSTKAATSTKTITTSEEEDLSLAPRSFAVTGTNASLYGFVDDPTTLSGQTVTIQKQKGDDLVTVGTAVIQADGSYSTKVRANKLFGKISSNVSASATKTVNLVASLTGSAIRASRTITLANRIRDSRR